MAQYVIGDIHGCLDSLKTLEGGLKWAETDCFITLGDYVDRGPNSRGVLDELIKLHKEDRVIPLRGNHEQLMLNARYNYLAFEGWLMSGGKQTLKSFDLPIKQSSLMDIPDRYWNFIENDCKLFHEDDTHIFVHANIDPDLEMKKQDSQVLLWRRFLNPRKHISGKTVICGHTAQANGLPKSYGYNICIDSWVYGDGWLTALDIESMTFWQSNEQREFRKGWIHATKVWVYPHSETVIDWSK